MAAYSRNDFLHFRKEFSLASLVEHPNLIIPSMLASHLIINELC